MSKVFSIHRQMQSSFKNKNKCKEISYSSSGWEEKAFYIPADTSRIPPFPCSHIKAASAHLPTSLWTKEDQLMVPLRPQIWEQAQQAESHTIKEPDFAILFCFTSSLEIKASCVSVTLLQPDFSSSLQPSLFCSELTSRTQIPAAADWALEGDVEGIFYIPSFREQN